MKTEFSTAMKQTESGALAADILRSCVHCGFCLATCPTYNLLGDEMNSPRGRIYLIKTMLEEERANAQTQQALDQCLVCRSCETTCPSGVEYHHLLDVGRAWLTENHPRSILQRTVRTMIRKSLTTPWVFNAGVTMGRLAKPLLPAAMKRQLGNGMAQVSNDSNIKAAAQPEVSGKVLLFSTCVQPALAPEINHKAKLVLQRLGVEVEETKQSECCGAVDQHLDAHSVGLTKVKANVDAWYKKLTEENFTMIVTTVSGCGAMIKDYGSLLAHDSEYQEKAAFVSEHHQDIAEYLCTQDLSIFKPTQYPKISVQLPCSLQHGQKVIGAVEYILTGLGYEIPAVQDAHFCCGSAGTYSIFQPKIAKKLAENKRDNLLVSNPEVIVSSNIGCISHLQAQTKTPVQHWITLL